MINAIISLDLSRRLNMERMTIEEFKNQSNIEIIESIMKINNGYVTSKELSDLGIHRMYLNIMKDKKMIEKVIGNNDSIEIVAISGLVTEFMKNKGIRVLARGIRDSEDLYYELKMSRMNKLLYPEMDTIFLNTSENYTHISSSLIKEILKFGGPIDGLVPEILIEDIKSKFIKK